MIKIMSELCALFVCVRVRVRVRVWRDRDRGLEHISQNVRESKDGKSYGM